MSKLSSFILSKPHLSLHNCLAAEFQSGFGHILSVGWYCTDKTAFIQDIYFLPYLGRKGKRRVSGRINGIKSAERGLPDISIFLLVL